MHRCKHYYVSQACSKNKAKQMPFHQVVYCIGETVTSITVKACNKIPGQKRWPTSKSQVISKIVVPKFMRHVQRHMLYPGDGGRYFGRVLLGASPPVIYPIILNTLYTPIYTTESIYTLERNLTKRRVMKRNIRIRNLVHMDKYGPSIYTVFYYMYNTYIQMQQLCSTSTVLLLFRYRNLHHHTAFFFDT